MGKARELSLQRRVDWMADTIDDLREQWTNKQLECEMLHRRVAELELLLSDEVTPDPDTTDEAGRAG